MTLWKGIYVLPLILLGFINIIPTDLADNRRSDGINLIYGGLNKWLKQLFLVQLDRKIIIK
jgi:hypothetical protein